MGKYYKKAVDVVRNVFNLLASEINITLKHYTQRPTEIFR